MRQKPKVMPEKSRVPPPANTLTSGTLRSCVTPFNIFYTAPHMTSFRVLDLPFGLAGDPAAVAGEPP